MDSKPKSVSQSYASVLSHLQGTDATTQTAADPNRSSTTACSTPSHTTVATQTDIITQTDDLCDPLVAGVKIRPYQ